jgi:hypothetical protein
VIKPIPKPVRVKKTKKKKKSNPISAAIKRADRWFNKFIVLRDKRCVICGSTDMGQCSHYYGKKACPSTRYDEDNAHRMCGKCHMHHHRFDDHMYDNWMRANYSSEALDTLQLKAHNVNKQPVEYYEGIEKKYKALVEQMEVD